MSAEPFTLEQAKALHLKASKRLLTGKSKRIAIFRQAYRKILVEVYDHIRNTISDGSPTAGWFPSSKGDDEVNLQRCKDIADVLADDGFTAEARTILETWSGRKLPYVNISGWSTK